MRDCFIIDVSVVFAVFALWDTHTCMHIDNSYVCFLNELLYFYRICTYC